MTQAKTSASHRVFLVDDDDALRTMMSLTLEHKGFEVVSAANVTEALKLLC
jgi:DNA-binding NtrC family response regulator